MSKLQYHGHPAIAQQIHMYMYVRSTVVKQYGGGVWGWGRGVGVGVGEEGHVHTSTRTCTSKSYNCMYP